MKNIAIFASGSGSNAQQIMTHFQAHPTIRVKLVVSNRPKAGVLERAKIFDISTLIISRKDFYESESVLEKLREVQIDFIALAGFLWLMPKYLVRAFPQQIVNIHPALLPKYGGKGMYGHHVHEAVKIAGEKETGMTIHYVNEEYDEGNIIFQAKCSLSSEDDSNEIARKVLALEHAYFASTIERLLTTN